MASGETAAEIAATPRAPLTKSRRDSRSAMMSPMVALALELLPASSAISYWTESGSCELSFMAEGSSYARCSACYSGCVKGS